MANAAPFIAPPLKRVAAGIADVVLWVFCFVTVVGVLYDWDMVRIYRGWMVAAVAAVTYALYHFAFFQSRWGATPGLRVLDMQLVRTDGGALSVLDALVRSAFRPGLLFFVGLSVDAFAGPLFPVEVVITGALILELGMMFYLPSRQTLADLAARTLVISVPPPQPHRAPAAPMYSPSDAEFGLPPRRAK